MSASELYTLPDDTTEGIKRFRFSSARAKHPEALIVHITNIQSLVIQETDPYPLESIEDLKEELPDNSPRFVLLSYPLTLPDGRPKTPFVLLYYMPPTASQVNRMTYAGAVELIRNASGVNKLIELRDVDDLDDIEKELL